MRRTFLGLLLILALGVPAIAGADRGSLTEVIFKLNREASVDADSPVYMAELIQGHYGTPRQEVNWAADQSISWGEIAALAYIQATTGRSFAAMVQDNARRDLWAYAEGVEMSCEKMALSLESFLKRAKRDRNTRIFDQLRASRRVHALPDLGSGFGLFQEALDFRRIDSPRPTKIHTVPGVLAKGEK